MIVNKLFSPKILLGVWNYAKMSSTTPIADSIKHKLSTNLNAIHLDVINESYMHNVPKGAETHFKVIVVSEKFNGLSLIKRHRLVNDLLKEEFSEGIHALSLDTKTPDQWSFDDTPKSSPPCLGGFGK
ncbi:hypothetical protein FQA39_LY13210 [Lamprigera yunnana]|nr:hypothetical protein FQA39_LY13210 [Lamprigera yunnana]